MKKIIYSLLIVLFVIGLVKAYTPITDAVGTSGFGTIKSIQDWSTSDKKDYRILLPTEGKEKGRTIYHVDSATYWKVLHQMILLQRFFAKDPDFKIVLVQKSDGLYTQLDFPLTQK